MSYSPFNGIGEASGLDREVLALQRQLMLLNQYLAVQDHENAGRIASSLPQEFPRHPDAWRALADFYRREGRSWNALGAQRKLLELEPNDAEHYFKLACLYCELGLDNEALTAYFQTALLDPDFDQAYIAIGQKIRDFRFSSAQPILYPVLDKLIAADGFVRPSSVAKAVLSLLSHDHLLEPLLNEPNAMAGVESLQAAIRDLDHLPLLHTLMKACPLPDLRFEALFCRMRRVALMHLQELEVSSELLDFLSTLAVHCFTNDYLYSERDDEVALVATLAERVHSGIEGSEPVGLADLLCLATYRPLHQFLPASSLTALDTVPEVEQRIVTEPLIERALTAEIRSQGVITDITSIRVRRQYENNPYPRWVRAQARAEAVSVDTMFEQRALRFHPRCGLNLTTPEILIAGCGTGQHAIESAAAWRDSKLLAVDISLASLSYAKRKTGELNLENIDFLHADILDLRSLNRQFDVVECVGVLHHMWDPETGLKVLTDLLKPGGLIKVGLYSEVARAQLTSSRQKASKLGAEPTDSQIREYRRELLDAGGEELESLCEWSDFFNLSEWRDLIFHAQEHRFSLSQIDGLLNNANIRFCGFENRSLIEKFKTFHGDSSSIYELGAWQAVEAQDQSLFTGMYQFWCQKNR
jgi:SAM-dependent methyltransferase